MEQENAALKRRIQELERMKGVEPSQQVCTLCNMTYSNVVEMDLHMQSKNALCHSLIK